MYHSFFENSMKETLSWRSDWGKVLFLSRRNPRDIHQTPEYIKPQLSAWLKSPSGTCLRKYAFLCSGWPNPSNKNVTNIFKPLRNIIIELKEERTKRLALRLLLHRGFLCFARGSAMVELQHQESKGSFQVTFAKDEWTSATHWEYQLHTVNPCLTCWRL